MRCKSLSAYLLGRRPLLAASRAQLVLATAAAQRRTVTSAPEDSLEQAQAAIRALDMAQQPVFTAGPPVTEAGIEQVMAKTVSTRKAKREAPMDEEQREVIRQKIAASMARKAAKVRYVCPACAVTLTRAHGVVPHMARCCPDLLDKAALQQGSALTDAAALQQLLTAAGEREQDRRRRALEITFLNGADAGAQQQTQVQQVQQPQQAQPQQQAQQAQQMQRTSAAAAAGSGDDEEDEDCCGAAGDAWEGGYSSRTRQRIQDAPADIAAQLGLPLARAQRLLKAAMRSVPIPADTSGQLQVVAEDEDFIAVNKPVGCHTAPVHRWQAGSMVNLLLGHLAAAAAAAETTAVPAAAETTAAPAAAVAGGEQQPQQMQQPQPQQQQQQQQKQQRLHVHATKPYVLHRLDYNTSGLLLFGKRREVVPGVSAAFRERRVSKAYLAITLGVPEQAAFTIDAPIGLHPWHDTARRVVLPGSILLPQGDGRASEAAAAVAAVPAPPQDAGGGSEGDGKAARTRVEVLSANPGFDAAASPGFAPGTLFSERGLLLAGSGDGAVCAADAAPGTAAAATAAPLRGVALVRCWPLTGRTHQIRVHMAAAGHPLLGDEVYGVTGPWIGRQALHARALALSHPLDGRPLRFVAPLHDDFVAALDALGLALPAEEAEQQGVAGGGSGGR